MSDRNIVFTPDANRWRSYDLDSQLNDKGEIAQFASARANVVATGESFRDLFDITKNIETAREQVVANHTTFFSSIGLYALQIVRWLAQWVLFPFNALKNLIDTVGHLAIGTVHAIAGKGDGKVVEAATLPSAFSTLVNGAQRPLLDFAQAGDSLVTGAKSSTWTTKSLPFSPATSLLLRDGRLLCQDEETTHWWTLSPNDNGIYAGGKWTRVADSGKARHFYASAVLHDGRVLVAGGEYVAGKTTDDNTAEIYDPQKNTWTSIPGPGWPAIGDAPCAVLPDGRVLLGSITSGATAVFDPTTNAWSDGGGWTGAFDEESWVLMPGGSILSVDCRQANQSKLWVPDVGAMPAGHWMSLGPVPTPLVDLASQEIGPALLLPDGRALFIGATGNTAFYTPAKSPDSRGVWASGPSLPQSSAGHQVVAKDAPAVLLPNGHVLFTATVAAPGLDDFGAQTFFYDLDPAAGTIAPASRPDNHLNAPFEGRFMLLPSGEVAYGQGTPLMSFQRPSALAATRVVPVIHEAPMQAAPGSAIQLTGTGFSGDSQTVAYGDDDAQAINYPLVRLTSAKGKVSYLTTRDLSNTGVATGTQPISTSVVIPASLAEGCYHLQVVAAGIPSRPVTLRVASVQATQLYARSADNAVCE